MFSRIQMKIKFKLKYTLYYLMIALGIGLVIYGLLSASGWSYEVESHSRFTPGFGNSGWGAILTFFGIGFGLIVYGLFEVSESEDVSG
jgi:hypothetical protein